MFPLASTLWEIKVIDKFGCMFYKHNNINANSPLAVKRFDQDQWKKKTTKEKQHYVFLFWPHCHCRND